MTRRKQSGRLIRWVAAVVVLLALLAVFGPSPQYLASSSRAYPHPYIPLEPADVPLVISIEAGKRLIAGELGVDAVVFARYTFAWPPGFTGGGRGLEPAGFPATDLTSDEVAALLQALANDTRPVPARDAKADGFLNSQHRVIFRLRDGSNAMLLVGRGAPPNLLVRSTGNELRYNTSLRSLFAELQDRARIRAEVALLYPGLGAAEEDDIGHDRLGAAYRAIKRYVAAAPAFVSALGQIDEIRLARGRNMIDTKAWPKTGTLTFRLRGAAGSGVVQAYLYREQVVAELIVTEHADQTEIGRFVRARGSPGA